VYLVPTFLHSVGPTPHQTSILLLFTRTGTISPGDYLLAVGDEWLDSHSLEEAARVLTAADKVVKLRIQKNVCYAGNIITALSVLFCFVFIMSRTMVCLDAVSDRNSCICLDAVSDRNSCIITIIIIITRKCLNEHGSVQWLLSEMSVALFYKLTLMSGKCTKLFRFNIVVINIEALYLK